MYLCVANTDECPYGRQFQGLGPIFQLARLKLGLPPIDAVGPLVSAPFRQSPTPRQPKLAVIVVYFQDVNPATLQ